MAGVTKNNALLAANVRSLALEQVYKALNDDSDPEFKKALLLKLSGSILPRLNEHTGTDGEPIKFDLVNYGQINSTLPIRSEGLSNGTPESSSEVQDSSTSSPSREVKDRTESTD